MTQSLPAAGNAGVLRCQKDMGMVGGMGVTSRLSAACCAAR